MEIEIYKNSFDKVVTPFLKSRKKDKLNLLLQCAPLPEILEDDVSISHINIKKKYEAFCQENMLIFPDKKTINFYWHKLFFGSVFIIKSNSQVSTIVSGSNINYQYTFSIVGVNEFKGESIDNLLGIFSMPVSVKKPDSLKQTFVQEYLERTINIARSMCIKNGLSFIFNIFGRTINDEYYFFLDKLPDIIPQIKEEINENNFLDKL